MSQIVLNTNNYFTASEEESFNRIVTTPLGSRVVRPFFGGEIHELVDRTMDEEWKMLFQRYLLECFFDEKRKPWDKRLVPKKTKIIKIDATSGEVVASIEFKDKEESLTFGIGGMK